MNITYALSMDIFDLAALIEKDKFKQPMYTYEDEPLKYQSYKMLIKYR